MKCSNCHREISPESKFCRFCGQKQELQEHNTNGGVDQSHNLDRNYIYAGFLIRLMAFIFDYALVFVIFIGIYWVVGDQIYDSLMQYESLVTYVAIILYNIFFLSTWSKTPGKALFGLTVLSKEDRHELNFGTSLKRSLLWILSTFFFGIGFWNMGDDPKKQAFHDKKAGTVVIYNKKGLLWPILLTLLATGFIITLFILGSAETT